MAFRLGRGLWAGSRSNVGVDAVEGCRHFLKSLGLWTYTQSTVLGQSSEIFSDSLASRNELARRQARQGADQPAVIPAEVPHDRYRVIVIIDVIIDVISVGVVVSIRIVVDIAIIIIRFVAPLLYTDY